MARRERAWNQLEKWASRNMGPDGAPSAAAAAGGGGGGIGAGLGIDAAPTEEVLRMMAESLVLEPSSGSTMTPSRWCGFAITTTRRLAPSARALSPSPARGGAGTRSQRWQSRWT